MIIFVAITLYHPNMDKDIKMIVYHGGTEIADHPDCKCGRRNLDFGQGYR